MDFKFSEEQESFRKEIKTFLKEEYPEGCKERELEWPGAFGAMLLRDNESEALTRQFWRKLAEKGWLCIGWPKEYGGGGRSRIDQLILYEEIDYYRAPSIDQVVRFEGPAIIAFGTEEQKKRFLPSIAKGELTFTEGLSEPGAGSDLGSIQTSAIESGDEFIINGQKTYTSSAHQADYCWLLARTDPKSFRFKGLSVFLVDMKTSGITIDPLINMLGLHHFNSVFFEDVRVPEEYLLGKQGEGWKVTAAMLNFERFATVRIGSFRCVFDELVEYVRERWQDLKMSFLYPLLRQRLAELAIEIELIRILSYRAAWMQDKGQVPITESSILRILGGELSQRFAKVAMQALKPTDLLGKDPKWASFVRRVISGCMDSISGTIGAGTSEIQRNIIANITLRLPKSF
jgi:hypothetical protein